MISSGFAECGGVRSRPLLDDDADAELDGVFESGSLWLLTLVWFFDRGDERLTVAIGTLSPNNSAFKTVENVRLASSSLRIWISLSAYPRRRKSGSTSCEERLKAACRSTPVRLGMYLSLNICLFVRLRGDMEGKDGASSTRGGSMLLVDRDGDFGVSSGAIGIYVRSSTNNIGGGRSDEDQLNVKSISNL